MLVFEHQNQPVPLSTRPCIFACRLWLHHIFNLRSFDEECIRLCECVLNP